MTSPNEQWTTALLLGLVAGMMAVYLGWLNVWGLNGRVVSGYARGSIAAFSIAILAAMALLAMIVGYFTPEREAIPLVENLGIVLIVLTVFSFITSASCFVAWATRCWYKKK